MDTEITLESTIDVGQGISLGSERFVKNNKRRAWKTWKKGIPVGRKKLTDFVQTCMGKKSYYKEITVLKK